MTKTILLRGGTTAQHAGFTGANREITVDTVKKTLVIHDGETAGGFLLAPLSSVPIKLSQLTENSGLWKKSVLTKVSQLTDDVGYWANLTKISQLQNDLSWKTGHCTYCSHCTYCKQCSRCNQVQCNQVHCTQVHCTQCSGYCTSVCSLCYAACRDCTNCRDCGDDGM